MDFDETLLNIDYLIYSSHKSATQTIAQTLRANGYNCIHCHSLTNETTRLELGTFQYFLEQYYLKNKKKLNIITTFREPIERHISSFFQWHAEGVIRKKIVQDFTDTIIYKCPIKELQEKFINELESQTLAGRLESLDEMCKELNITASDLDYSTSKQYGEVEMQYCRLFIFRFDILIYENRLADLLSQITEKSIIQHDANVSSSKWYHDTYAQFKASLKIPYSTISRIYESKRHILNLLYPGEYDFLLSRSLKKYG
jgi:hypothetical protein